VSFPRARTLFGRLAEYRVSDQSGFARYPPCSLTPDALCWVISSLTWPSGSSVIMASDVRSPSRIVWSNLERAANPVNIPLKTMTYVHMYVRKYVAQYVTCCGASGIYAIWETSALYEYRSLAGLFLLSSAPGNTNGPQDQRPAETQGSCCTQ
jgi:hypothetical protein